MVKCTECSNAVFDNKYGDFGCRVKECAVGRPEQDRLCDNYKEGTPTINKEDK